MRRRRRVTGTDLKRASPSGGGPGLLKETFSSFWRDAGHGHMWAVCRKHTIEERDGQRFFEPAHPFDLRRLGDTWRFYEPLEDRPDLFIRFAGLRREDGPPTEEAMLEWVDEHGLLGLGPPIPPGARGKSGLAGRRFGGPGDHVRGFEEEVEKAAGVLAIYEAALGRDVGAARRAIVEEFPYLSLRAMWPSAAEEFEEWEGYREANPDAGRMLAELEEGYDPDYLEEALRVVVQTVGETVQESCFPVLEMQEVDLDDLAEDPAVLQERGVSSGDTGRIFRNWGFTSLLDAMYLQLYWFVGSGRTFKRCAYCNNPLSFAPKGEGGKGRRSTRKFCDNACRQAHYRAKSRRPT